MIYFYLIVAVAAALILIYTQHLRAQLHDFINNGPDWYEVPQLHEVSAEMQNQLLRWGVQDHPSGGPAEAYLAMTSEHAKQITESSKSDGSISWADICLEEFAEALDAQHDIERRAELIQLGAVVMTWIENIDNRTYGATVPR